MLNRFIDWLSCQLMGDQSLKTLYVMRTEDIHVIHPATNWDYQCEVCGSKVGVFPSGQAFIKKFKRDRVFIICIRCESPPVPMPVSLQACQDAARD